MYQQPYDSEVVQDESEDKDEDGMNDEENVDLEEADELNSDKGSAAARGTRQAIGGSFDAVVEQHQDGQAEARQKQLRDMNNTGKFNDLMNQIIGEFSENDPEAHDLNEQFDPSAILAQTPDIEHSKAQRSRRQSSIAQSTKVLPPSLSSLSNQYMSNPTPENARPRTGANLTVIVTDLSTTAINHSKKESMLPTTRSRTDSTMPGSTLSLPHPSKSLLEHKLNQIHLDFVYVSARVADVKKALELIVEQISQLDRGLSYLHE